MTADAILDRLKGEWLVISESWLSFATMAVIAGCFIWLVIHLLDRKRIANLRDRLDLRDDQLANARDQIGKLERDLESLAGERQARQDLGLLVASLREQLANAQPQLLVAPRTAAFPAREASRQARLDELFGPGSAIDGKLAKGEAQRLIVALDQLTALTRAKLGSDRTSGSTPLAPSRLGSTNGSSWWFYVSRTGIPHAIELVSAYRADVIEFANSLETVIVSQPDLEFRLRRIVGNVRLIADLLNIVGGFIRSMERLNDGETYKPAVLEMALGSPFQIMVQAQTAVDSWMQLFIEHRAPAAHREAATYL